MSRRLACYRLLSGIGQGRTRGQWHGQKQHLVTRVLPFAQGPSSPVVSVRAGRSQPRQLPGLPRSKPSSVAVLSNRRAGLARRQHSHDSPGRRALRQSRATIPGFLGGLAAGVQRCKEPVRESSRLDWSGETGYRYGLNDKDWQVNGSGLAGLN